jgi:hypothetical protein
LGLGGQPFARTGSGREADSLGRDCAANVIVTDDLCDFAPTALASLNLSVQSADDFLVSQFEVDPRLAAAGVRQQLARLQRPLRRAAEHIALIRSSLPGYAEVLEEVLPLLSG